VLTIRAMAGGATYARNHLSNNDYYSEGETVQGHWMGHGAELLGLKGEVTMEQFDAIRECIHPSTGEFLRQRHSADRSWQKEVNGKVITQKTQARNLYDLTLSAPKAVSLLAMEDPRIAELWRETVTETFQAIEPNAAAYVRAGGANRTRVTGNLIVARYDHDTSRELDPNLHAHLIAANLTYDGVERKWKALAPYEIYQQAGYITEVCRNILARKLAEHGYAIENRLEHGKNLGFSFPGIQESTLEKYSQRSSQRERAIQEFIGLHGRRPSNNEVAVLIRETREPKLKHITTAEVKAAQLARLDPEEAETLRRIRQDALGRGPIRQYAAPGESLAYAKEHIFERVSVAKQK
jgi:conjugative relaxase-like TrwC/TraI family protein